MVAEKSRFHIFLLKKLFLTFFFPLKHTKHPKRRQEEGKTTRRCNFFYQIKFIDTKINHFNDRNRCQLQLSLSSSKSNKSLSSNRKGLKIR